ncbi:TPA: host cell division inhibitor Icd-like protein [Klebsiella pneumoniae]|uniref:Ash protein family protein n=1 Tax=Klebsiella pneumoniae TaxID=573 RepID=A0A8D6Q7B5_KLEPN|nr:MULTISPECIES: host cell division inhibitor Icd-like protein [Klebsiella]MCQ0894451.1 host cell division inhibitor Icd-like protein [Klebsiella pneumoniae]MCW9506595.1 host cell division inhibitor Icd-like protein [Klebsiella oxytoca]SWC18223.1 fructokinase [Klebsiella pneumoniae]SWC24132.1 fructokinase [Klebsiella pneumoniae]SWC55706.1 fructokinase [Klebsiella pneumoniae]
MIAAAQGKSLSLAGLMPPCSGFKTLAKLSFSFTNKENYFPRIAARMNNIATYDGRAAWDFETSTREFKDALANCRTVTREFSGTLEASFVTSTRDGCHTCSKEFCESIKKGLPTIANPVYGYSAPAKSGAGIGVPVIIRAHNTRHACFFVPRSYTPSMVDCMGAEQSAPVSLIPGYANPVQFTTSEIGVSGGGYQDHESEAAYMLATTPTQNPQFIWLIAAVRRDMPTITAKIHHIAAETEQEARRILARDHVCFFAGRIRTGGAHA